MKQIKFKRFGSSTLLGNFAPGEIARVDDRVAAHLVGDLDVADYLEAPAPPEPAPAEKPKGKRK